MRLTKRKKIVLIIIGLILLVFFMFWWFFGKVEVEAFRVKQGSAISGVTVTGTVQADEDVQLASSVTAKIKSLNFNEGDFVTRGQILALLDKEEAQGYITTAKGQLESARAQVENLLTEPRYQQVEIARAQVSETQENIRTLEQDLSRTRIQLRDALSNESRLLRLYTQGAVSYREYESAALARAQVQTSVTSVENQIAASRARLVQARENLSLIEAGTKIEQIQVAQGQVLASKGSVQSAVGRYEDYIIKAPITGYITRKILDKGEIASPNMPILRLVTPESLYVSAQVEENQLKDVKIGQQAYIIFDAYPTQTFVTSVYEILRDVDPLTGTFIAKVAAPKKQGKPVLVGMTSDVTIISKKINNAVIIPSDFVSIKNKQSYVYKLQGNKAVKAPIVAMNFDNNRINVIKGISPGDIIVRGFGNRKVQNGNRVKIKNYYRE